MGIQFHQHSYIYSKEACQTIGNTVTLYLISRIPLLYITCLVFLGSLCFTLNFDLLNMIPSTIFGNAF